MKLIQKNKKAYFDYEILQEFTAGLILTGPEIKSIRKGNINLKGAYITILKDEPILKNAHVSKYQYDSSADFDPIRDRKILLTEKELRKISNSLNTQGVTIVVLAIGLVGKYAKVQIAMARGKKKHDKRETIKGRDQKRSLDRLTKNYTRR